MCLVAWAWWARLGGRHTKLLQLQGQARVAFNHQLLQGLDGLGSGGAEQLLPLGAGGLDFLLVVGIGGVQLPQDVFLDLGGALWALQAQPPAAFGVAGPGAVVVLGQTVVLGLCLVHGRLGIGRPLFGVQALVFPVLATALDVARQLGEVLVHLVERQGVLHAVVGHALVQAHNLVELADMGALAQVGLVDRVHVGLGQAAQTVGMVFFDRGALLEKGGKVLCMAIMSTGWTDVAGGRKGVGRTCIPWRKRCSA